MAALLDPPALAGLGVVALHGRRVVGLLAPLTFDLWGSPAAYVPEWGQAATDPGLIPALYEAAAQRWVEAGRIVHAVTLWEHQEAAESAWHGLGFGRAVVDAVRGLEKPPTGRRVVVRPAGRRDAYALARLEGGLWDHLAAPPVCRIHPGPGGRDEAARRLADPSRPVWLAEVEGTAVGFVSLEPGDDSPAALRSPETVRCDGAFVAPGVRGRGIGRALVGAALRWAAGAGFTACALDYEAANPPAARFWPGLGFEPVLHSLARRLR